MDIFKQEDNMNTALDIFIEGELVDLCIPTEESALNSNWYSLFNDKNTTRYLDQGVYPNTREKQLEYFKYNEDKRLLLIVSDKEKYIGVISLSEIDYEKRRCEIAMVLRNSEHRRFPPYVSLEAMARITEHAFTAMGMNRVEAGQHANLSGWQQRLELIGFRVEGLHVGKFVKGKEIANLVRIACTYEYYQEICMHRGSLWDGYENMKDRYSKLPSVKFIDLLTKFYQDSAEGYYRKINSL